ncbi:MAG: metallophosphoesterase [Tissierellia bacterium]|nr:metallophosphoesterase [Tissierellia bacterium]
MKLIKNIYSGFLSIFNYPYISKDLLENLKGPIILHISDTPVDIYAYIFRIIDILKPKFIIHTGDLADNIKLEYHRDKIVEYQKEVAKLIEGLEKNEEAKVFYVLGNHDEYETVSKLTKRGTILEEGLINIENYNLIVGHYYMEHSDKVDFCLYGHSFSPSHFQNKDTIGLNGVLNINIIDLSCRAIYHLDYPIGTNRSRMMELRRITL